MEFKIVQGGVVASPKNEVESKVLNENKDYFQNLFNDLVKDAQKKATFLNFGEYERCYITKNYRKEVALCKHQSS